MMHPVRAFVAGCSGLALDDTERRFFAAKQPWGLILFKRNVANPDQVASLAAAFRECTGRADAPVLIDQEGGRVQRLGPPHWPNYPAGAAYAGFGESTTSTEAARLGGQLIGEDLRAVGISVDCAPVLDIATPATHQAIGNRTFGAQPDEVARLGRAFADGLLAAGVLPVMKHCPGHGRATVDSHFDLPVVTASRAELEAADFKPFRALADLPMAMTAHVVFEALDPDHPATTSFRILRDLIRGEFGFDGLLLSDDLSMQALRGSVGERARASLAAGCDIALHCNGRLDEAEAVAAEAPVLEGLAAERARRALSLIAAPPVAGTRDARERFAEITASAA